MRCPKCNGEMSTFDRLGIHVEQCQSCRGIFLDYGELEQIVATEEQHYAAVQPPPLQQPGAPAAPAAPMPPPAAPMPAAGQPAGYHHRPDSPSPYYGRPDSPGPFGSRGGGQYGPRKKKSIFQQLFD